MNIQRLAFTDFEMTGIDPLKHEIIEFGALIVDAETLEVVNRFEQKVRPEHIENADVESLRFTGYKEEAWSEAVSLSDALSAYSALVKDSVFVGWNVVLDWMFLKEACKTKNIAFPFDHYTIDIVAIAYEKLRTQNHENVALKLTSVCKYFDIPKEPFPHRAINGAEKALEIYKKLRAL